MSAEAQPVAAAAAADATQQGPFRLVPPKPVARSLFVTVGSTLFPELTDAILSRPLLDQLVKLGVERLFVQIGKSKAPEKVQHAGGWSSRENEGSFRHHVPATSGLLVVEWVRYTGEFEKMVEEADAVISHAGSGSILMALHAQKPLLVVPNENLMDNHQAQLANALEAQQYLMVSSVENLWKTLPNFLAHRWIRRKRPFPELDGSRFRDILDETAGFDVQV